MELAVGVVDYEQIGLLRVRPFHDRADGAGIAVLEHEHFLHEGAVLAEELHAVVLAVAHHDQAVVGDGDAVHRIGEVLRRRRREPLVP